MSTLIHRHKKTPGDGSPQIEHSDLLGNQDPDVHPQYILGPGDGYRAEQGYYDFAVGNASQAITFTTPFTSVPIILVSLERSGALQIAGKESVTVNGFTFNRSSSGGTARGHWRAIGAA
jgi:hypothetical protein